MKTELNSDKIDESVSGKLIDLVIALSKVKELDDSFRLVAQRTTRLLQADIVLILMFNPTTYNTLKTIYKEGRVIDDPHYRFIQNQVSGWISKNKQSLLCADISTDQRFHKRCFDDFKLCSVIGTPLQIDGALIGTLIVFNSKKQVIFSTKHLDCLEKIALISAPYLHRVESLESYFKKPVVQTELIAKYNAFGLFGQCSKFVELLHAIDAATQCDVRVLLEGGSGTGKELIARAIHANSGRKNGPFIAIDCGAIPANLMESELFGHVKGAFTGATSDRRGLIEEANHGTLFMDEIINLPLDMQSKLMRVLQENALRPVGSNKTHAVDVRILAAASKSLHQAVRQGLFRDDLYYRLYVYPISIPSLHERKDDIPLLANLFLRRFAEQQHKIVERFHADMVQFMKFRSWEGNIRELENFVERLVTLAPLNMRTMDSTILPETLKTAFKKINSAVDYNVMPSLNESVSEYEEQIIRDALVTYNWNQSRAAKALKISVQALRYKMMKLGIMAPE